MADDATEQPIMSDSDGRTDYDAEPKQEEAPTTTETAPQAEADYEPVQPSAPGGDYENKEDAGANVELQAMSQAYNAEQSAGDALAGKYIECEFGGQIINFQVKSVGDHLKDTTSQGVTLSGGGPGEKLQERTKTIEEEQAEEIWGLVPDSTNAWLYIEDKDLDPENAGKQDEDETATECCEKCTENGTNKFIAVFVIVLQIAAYIAMTVFLINSRDEDFESQQKSCYGQYCGASETHCMTFGTGGLTSVLLVGFLWADVVNTLFLIRRSCTWAIASCFVLAELFTAIICGFLVGVYSESDFDAIGGAVGILFVHDLDEKVFASMQVFRGQKCATFKKGLAIALWIILSIAVALGVACKYEDGSYFGTCKDTEFACKNGDCIWEGFQCNGIEDCSDGSDEGSDAKCSYALHNLCPVNTTFQCVENGACIDADKRCNGILDCPAGSDEGRNQNCSEVIARKKCSNQAFNRTLKYPEQNDTYHEYWTGIFKCNNGQCINAKYACDGQTGDCVDGSDEYPTFYKGKEYPFLRTCPYAKLIECDDNSVLCKVNGQCIAKSQLCDGSEDCPDGADEKNCQYNCQSKVTARTDFQCGGKIASINKTNIVFFKTDNGTGNAYDYSNNTLIDQNTITYTKDTDLDPFFDGETGKCIPTAFRCDGIYDCPADTSDEQLCLIFGCASSDYQCSDTGTCIPKSWLCDGVQDCDNNEDENTQICKANGVSLSGDSCVAAGYQYQCKGVGAGICLYYYAMCDNYQDCPENDDETVANCQAAYNNLVGQESGNSGTESTSAPGGDGSVACGDTKKGTGSSYNIYSFTWTYPAGQQSAKISTCVSDNQGEASLVVCPAATVNDFSTCFFPFSYDGLCPNDCSYRYTILSQDYNLVPGTDYIIGIEPFFTGNYAFTVECAATSAAFSGGAKGGTCTYSAPATTKFVLASGFEQNYPTPPPYQGGGGYPSFPSGGGSPSYPSGSPPGYPPSVPSYFR